MTWAEVADNALFVVFVWALVWFIYKMSRRMIDPRAGTHARGAAGGRMTKEAGMPEFKIGVVELKPGDTLVFKSSCELTPEVMQHITDSLAHFREDGHKVLVLSNSVDLQIIRAAAQGG